MNRANNSNLRLCRMILIMILPMTTSIGWADHGGSRHAPWGLTVPPSSTGNYSVSWTTSLTVQLQEKVGGGAYNTIYSGNASPQSFTNKPPGTYTYRLYRSFYSQRRGLIERYSAPVTTVVSGGSMQPPQWDGGFDSDYQVRSGDLNLDGLVDLFVSDASPTNMSVEDFVLTQNADGSFSVLHPLTSTQLGVVSGWPVSSIEVAGIDLNLDEQGDLVLAGLLALTGTPDVIVYAPTTSGASIGPTKSVDDELDAFFSDTVSWIVNPNYFEENALEIVEEIETEEFTYLGYSFSFPFYLPIQCLPFDFCGYLIADIDDPGGMGPDDPNIQNVFHWWGWDIVTETVVTLDYSIFSQDALLMTDVINAAGTNPLSSNDVAIIVSILESILGVDISAEAIPIPRDDPAIEDEVLGRLLRRLGLWFALLSIPSSTEQVNNYYYHYTSELGAAGIKGTGHIISASGLVFFTQDTYNSAVAAKAFLALPELPAGYFAVHNSRISGLTFLGTVQPKYNEPGGGTEWTGLSPVQLGFIRRFIRVPP